MSIDILSNYNEITALQEAYAVDLFNGVYQRKAYQNHYDTENQTLATIDANASRLANNVKVKAHIAMLKAKVSSPIILDKKQRLEALSGYTSERHIAGPSVSDKISAIREIGKLLGDYPTEARQYPTDVHITVSFNEKTALKDSITVEGAYKELEASSGEDATSESTGEEG